MTFLKELKIDWKLSRSDRYPFDIESIRSIESMSFENSVTFFVGENGSGKSTLIESIARKCGFGIQGGNKDYYYDYDSRDDTSLSSIMRLSWLPKVTDGFFLRGESVFNLASRVDDWGMNAYYGYESIHTRSHGQAFMMILEHQFKKKGIYILDEPESALSPQRQLAFLSFMDRFIKETGSQFIIATHSPIIMAYPDASIYSFDDGEIRKVGYEETDHYQITRNFLDNRERTFKYLFQD